MNKLRIGFLFVCIFLFISGCPALLDVTILQTPSIAPFKKKVFEIDRPLIFLVGTEKFIVPHGFQTDLASIPRIAYVITNPINIKYINPAIAHDFLYTCSIKSRAFSDDVFYNLMIQNKVNHLTAYLMWSSVRLFGYGHFRNTNGCV